MQEAEGSEQEEIGGEQRAVGGEEQTGSPARFFIESGGKDHFDLWAANAAQLAEAGLAAERVELAGISHASAIRMSFSRTGLRAG